ncbi:MAG: 2-amino-4-hydroxy-6-hydroxymethyldihydropteridine diphosphokinase [Woeseiaceae bacterium]|jgi:2-amino-4-hydroxy-6-hydroxymethyldihydropteridine diphosphokinase|tara:strand:- start:22059 stop:22556 length:498 start_codon:yes stop_codon:yes gene_type:complete
MLMSHIYLGIGSNDKPKENIRLAIKELRGFFGKIQISPVYKNKAVGFKGEDFLNLVVAFHTELSVKELMKIIEKIHALSGRKRTSEKFSSRTLDIDLLLYGQDILNNGDLIVPREDILKYSFVLKPLSEMAPNLIHPETKQSIISHWKSMSSKSDDLQLVGIELN